jgi:hypothetical protein
MRLKAHAIRSLRPGKHVDGRGLLLRVRPSGARYWLFRFQRGGQDRVVGLGSLDDVPLEQARDLAHEHRKRLRSGSDPQAEIARERAAVASQTFEEVVVEVLTSIWSMETGKRLRARIEQVTKGMFAGDNPARWARHLKHLFLKRRSASAVRTIMPRSIGGKLPSLRNPSERSTASTFLILTAARTNEVIGMRWCEVDEEAAVWTCPAERMKRSRFRIVRRRFCATCPGWASLFSPVALRVSASM